MYLYITTSCNDYQHTTYDVLPEMDVGEILQARIGAMAKKAHGVVHIAGLDNVHETCVRRVELAVPVSAIRTATQMYEPEVEAAQTPLECLSIALMIFMSSTGCSASSS